MGGTALAPRLHFVVGKGGVGKTTVAAALAQHLTRRGRRTLAIEMDTAGRLAAVLGVDAAGYAPKEAGPGLHVMSVDGRAALEEYLGMIIPVRRLLSTVFSSRVYQYFVAAAPGLKELMTVGKICYETERREDDHPVWDAIVVDAAATGHSLQYLRMPQTARETFGAGLVQREATKIMALLRDPLRTAVHLVTLAEEMPVAETLETRHELVETLGLPLGLIVVNRVHARRFDPALVTRLREAACGVPAAERMLVAAVADRAAEESAWSALNAHYLAQLRAGAAGTPFVVLPFLFREEFGRAEIRQLAAAFAELEPVRERGRA